MDLSKLSDTELAGLQGQLENPLASMSDADLSALHSKLSRSTAEDLGAGAIGGIARLATGTLGLPGDLGSLLNRGIDYGAQKLGLPVAPANYDLGTSAQIQRGVESLTGKFPEAQSLPGKALQNSIEFGLGAVGPGGLAKLPARALVGAVAPGVAMTATEQATDNPLVNVATPVIASILAHKAITPKPPTAAIAGQELKDVAQSQYGALTQHNVATPIPASELSSVVTDAKALLNTEGPRQSVAKKAYAAVEEIGKPSGLQPPTSAYASPFHLNPTLTPQADIADLVSSRQALRSLARETKDFKSTPNAAAASKVLPLIEQKIEQLSPNTMQELRTADKNYAGYLVGNALDRRNAIAELRAASEHSGLNLGNKLLQQRTNLLVSKEGQRLPAQTKAELEKLGSGVGQNLTRWASKILGGGGGVGALAAGFAGYGTGGAALGEPGAVAAPLLGLLLAKGYNRSISKQAEKISALARARSPEGLRRAGLLGPQTSGLTASQTALITGLLAARERGLLSP